MEYSTHSDSVTQLEDLTTDGGGGSEQCKQCTELFQKLMELAKTEPSSFVALASSLVLSRSVLNFVLDNYEKSQPKPDEDNADELMAFWMEGYEDLQHMRQSLDWAMNYCTRQMHFRLVVCNSTEEKEKVKQWVQE